MVNVFSSESFLPFGFLKIRSATFTASSPLILTTPIPEFVIPVEMAAIVSFLNIAFSFLSVVQILSDILCFIRKTSPPAEWLSS